jgi:hypothetical protein
VNKKGDNRSYFSVGRGRKKILVIIIPIVAAVIITLVVLSSMSGLLTPSNKMVLHNHVNVNVTYNGQAIMVPEHIGIVQIGKADDPLLYGDHSLDKYGMEGMSPLHTHDNSGTVHVEANTKRDFTLGEFLDTWKGLDINGKTVQASLNRNSVSEYRNIILNNGDSY